MARAIDIVNHDDDAIKVDIDDKISGSHNVVIIDDITTQRPFIHISTTKSQFYNRDTFKVTKR